MLFGRPQLRFVSRSVLVVLTLQKLMSEKEHGYSLSILINSSAVAHIWQVFDIMPRLWELRSCQYHCSKNIYYFSNLYNYAPHSSKVPFHSFFWRLEGIIFSWLFRLVSKPNTVRYFVLEPAVVCYIMLKSTLMLIIKSMSFCCNLVLEQVSAPVKNFSKTNISSKKLAFLRQFPFELL